MIKVEHIDVWGFRHAIRGMRNPLESWGKSDSRFTTSQSGEDTVIRVVIGNNDLRLMKKLYKAGPEERKYLRMIHISMDVTAPLYWWKEYDTYKVGTVANSCSTMHRIHARAFVLNDFSHEHLYTEDLLVLDGLITELNVIRDRFMHLKDKDDWWQMIQLLPSSYMQKRTLDLNYETAAAIIRQRSNHKLNEWRTFASVLRRLPYMSEIIEE